MHHLAFVRFRAAFLVGWFIFLIPLSAEFIGYWPCDETSGSKLHDSINGNTAICNGGAISRMKGRIKGSVVLKKSSRTRANFLIKSIPQMAHASALSISCWVRSSPLNKGYKGIVMTRDVTDSNGPKSNWGIARYNDGTVEGRVSAQRVFGEAQILAPRQWTHLVFTWDAKNQNSVVYVNNVASARIPVASNKQLTSIISSGQWYFGLDPSQKNRNFIGAIDDVAMWNTALSHQDVRSLYQAGLKGKGAHEALLKSKHWDTDQLKLTVETFASNKPYRESVVKEILTDIQRVIDTCRRVVGGNTTHQKSVVKFLYNLEEPTFQPATQELQFPRSVFEEIYKKYRNGERELPLVFLQTAIRIFWHENLNYRIAYQTIGRDRSHDWWMLAVARAIGFTHLNDDKLTIQGADAKAARRWKITQRTYQNSSASSWHNNYGKARPVIANGRTLDDFLASFLYSVSMKHGGSKFLDKWLSEVHKLDPIETYRHRSAARDNFAIAASRAAGKDLSGYLNEIKWTCSEARVQRALKE